MSRSPPTWGARDDAWWARVAAVASTITVAVSLVTMRLGPTWEIVVLGALTVLGFLVRSVWLGMPTAVLLAWTLAPAIVLNLRGDGEGTMFLIVIAISYATLTQPRRRDRIAIGLAGVAIPPLVNLVAYDQWGWPFWMMGILFGSLSSAQVRKYRLLVAELDATRERLTDQAVDAERRRIAAEVHDLVGHSLTVVLLHLTAARRRVQDDPAGAATALVEAEQIGRRSLAEIRRNVALLRGDVVGGTGPIPTAADVPALIASARSAGTDVGFDRRGDLAAVEPLVGLAVFRVVQEGLVNAATHASGAAVRVAIDVTDEWVHVEIADTGGRSTSPAPPGVGLVGMRERVTSLGGELVAGPDGAGWKITARLPRAVRTDPPVASRP